MTEGSADRWIQKDGYRIILAYQHELEGPTWWVRIVTEPFGEPVASAHCNNVFSVIAVTAQYIERFIGWTDR